MNDYTELTELQKSDFEWFTENFHQLWEQYGDCYLVLSNKQVLYKHDNPGDAVRAGLSLKGPGNFIVQECTKDASCYTAEVGCVFC